MTVALNAGESCHLTQVLSLAIVQENGDCTKLRTFPPLQERITVLDSYLVIEAGSSWMPV